MLPIVCNSHMELTSALFLHKLLEHCPSHHHTTTVLCVIEYFMKIWCYSLFQEKQCPLGIILSDNQNYTTDFNFFFAWEETQLNHSNYVDWNNSHFYLHLFLPIFLLLVIICDLIAWNFGVSHLKSQYLFEGLVQDIGLMFNI